KRLIRVGRRCGLRFGAEDEVGWIGLGDRLLLFLVPIPKRSPDRATSFLPFLCYLLSHRPSTPLLHYSIPHEVPCNLSRRFPLYGVEADGLPAKAAQRKAANVDKNYKYRLLILTTTSHAGHAITRPIAN